MPFAPPPSRRTFFRAAAAGALGLSVPELLAAANRASAARPGRAKNVLVILEQGGLSHMDTWDPKPGAVADHRSPFKPIATRVPGMRFTELLTETARVADKLAVVRSMRHPKAGAGGHPEGTRYMLSGAHPASTPAVPDIGSVAAHVLGPACPYLPPYVMVPGNHEQSAQTATGFLPAGPCSRPAGGTCPPRTGGWAGWSPDRTPRATGWPAAGGCSTGSPRPARTGSTPRRSTP